MTISWLQITVTTDRTQLAEAVFEQYAAQAITELDDSDDLIVEETPHSQPAFDRAQVLGLFSRDTPAEPIVAALQSALGADIPIQTQILENQDWASAWLAEHPPMVFGNRLWIAPHKADVAARAGDTIVRLDPGLAFGTGTHPTTSLCLHWLARQPLAGRRVLDYGCGSGILAVAAALLGAEWVVAVDIDEQARRATQDNAYRNHVGDRIATPVITDLKTENFDIVLANILAKPLIQLAPTLARLTAPGAPVVLSGLLSRQIDEVRQAYASDFTVEAAVLEQDWARLVGWRHG